MFFCIISFDETHDSSGAGMAHHVRHLDTQVILSIVFAAAAFAAVLLGFLGIWFCRRKSSSKPDMNVTLNRGTHLSNCTKFPTPNSPSSSLFNPRKI